MVHQRKYHISDIEYFSVRFTPRFQKSPDLDNYCCNGNTETIYERYDSLRFFENMCSEKNVHLRYRSEFMTRPKIDSDITLLITFNNDPKLFNIEMLHHLYRYQFKNVIFCGNSIISNILNEIRAKSKKFDSYTFIDIDKMDME